MSETDFKLAAVILSGGQGSRMGGQDKGLMLIDGRPMIINALELVSRFTRSFSISCNRNQSTYSQFKCALVGDLISGFQGPLAGIHAGLSHYEDQFTHLLVMPCDTPKVSEDLIAQLIHSAQENPSSICHLESAERPQFLHAVIPVHLLKNLTAWLEQGNRAVYKWYKQHPVVVVGVSNQSDLLRNINSHSDVV